jgi:tryptophan synthase beta chain
MRDWVTNVDTHYLLGSALGAHPYPMMVRDFHRVIGDEARGRFWSAEGRLPDADLRLRRRRQQRHRHLPRLPCDAGVKLIGVEAGGRGAALGEHAARFAAARPACCTARTAICCRMTTARWR